MSAPDSSSPGRPVKVAMTAFAAIVIFMASMWPIHSACVRRLPYKDAI
jgi:hypothetical protein